MNARDFRAHGVLALLLVAAMAWAYALSRPEWWPQGEGDRPVPLWSLDTKDIERVEFTQGTSRVVLRMDPDQLLQDGSPSVWIEAQGPAAAPEGQPARPGQAPAPGKPTTAKAAAPSRVPSPKPPAARQPVSPQGLKAAQTLESRAHAAEAASAKTPAAAPTAAGSAAPGAVPTPAPVGELQRASFRGGAGAANLVRQVAQLAALRDLGHASAAQLQAFGLDKPAGTLRIERGSPGDKTDRKDAPGTLQLDLGLVTHGGASQYVALQPGGRVYLVSVTVFRQLEHPRRLMDREWLPFNLFEASRIDAKIGARTLTVYHVKTTPPPPQRWALKADAPQGDPNAQAWVQTLMGVKVLDYPGVAGMPGGAETQLEVTVYPAADARRNQDKASAGGPAEEPVVLRVYKATGKAGEVRAVSPYTAVPVTFSAASIQAVIDRARPLLGTQ